MKTGTQPIDYEKIERYLAREPRSLEDLFDRYGLRYCGKPILLDATVAQLFGISTKSLIQTVKRNQYRLQVDFVWQSTPLQFSELRSQFVTSVVKNGGTRHLPYVFTKEGVAMLSGIVKTPAAVDINVEMARALGRSSSFWTRTRFKTEVSPPRF